MELRARFNVLIVDDHEDLADTLALLVEHHGHEARVARCGVDGLALARTSDPDVAFLDVGLPDFDGYELARRLRLQGSSALLVAFTGFSGRTATRRCMDAGFDRHVVKPAVLGALSDVFTEVGARRLARAATACPR
jgi:CheY-like chemotaxis protein